MSRCSRGRPGVINVSLHPWFDKADRGDGGIRRVVEAQRAYLPEFGIQPVPEADQADVIACHALELVERPGIPLVAHNHGLYWGGIEWGAWADQANRQVAELLRRAKGHTAPSFWVSHALRRGLLIYPEVIYHGVDAVHWRPAKDPGGFVLWNKAREDPVSDPADMNQIAGLLPEVGFVSTFGKAAPNVRLIGRIPFAEMKAIIEQAGVFLVTPRETFGVGTLEAMAAGVPIAGWAWGGQLEIVRQGVTGYLAEPGNYAELADCVRRCLAERERLGANARADVLDRWAWRPRIAQYADFYRRVYNRHGAGRGPAPAVSVIVTCYNLGRFLADCLGSVQAQTFPDWECLIVDDCSTDNTPEIAQAWTRRDGRFRYLRTPENLKLSGARNYGIAQAGGRYVIMLDADDMLDKQALTLLAEALDRDPGIHIAAGHLDVIQEDGTNRRRNQWPGKSFSWHGQLAHLNQIPYASLVRREVWERAGGYRRRAWRAEDAEAWCRLTSFGFRAEKVTEAPVLVYRLRSDSKSGGEPGDGDWTAWFPWRLGDARTNQGNNPTWKTVQRADHPNPGLVPFGAVGPAPAPRKFWDVNPHDRPAVSIIIPVGPGHEGLLIDALDSVLAQTFPNWECIVINDTGKAWGGGIYSPTAGAPWAKIISTGGQKGTGAARNAGARAASSPALVFLDADDLLMPGFLAAVMPAFEETGGKVYTDWFKNDGRPDSPMSIFTAVEFRCEQILDRMGHVMTCLIPKAAHDQVGGFNEDLPGWEDWDYLIKIHAQAGVCGVRVPQALTVYRFTMGTRREDAHDKHKAGLVDYLKSTYADYYGRKVVMGCGGCPKGQAATYVPRAEAVSANGGAAVSDNMIEIAYQGKNVNKITFRGPVTGRRYKVHAGAQVFVHEADLRGTEDKQGLADLVQWGVRLFPFSPGNERRSATIPAPAARPTAHAPGSRPAVEILEPFAPDLVEIGEPGPGEQDPGEFNIPEIRDLAAGLTLAALQLWLLREKNGKARKGALEVIQAEIDRKDGTR